MVGKGVSYLGVPVGGRMSARVEDGADDCAGGEADGCGADGRGERKVDSREWREADDRKGFEADGREKGWAGDCELRGMGWGAGICGGGRSDVYVEGLVSELRPRAEPGGSIESRTVGSC
jgi:hypothetical protein